MFLVRLTRVVPFIIALAVIALIIYFVASFRLPSPKAKQIVIRFFFVIMTACSVFFAIATLYGFLDNNMFGVELFASFLAVSLIGLGITALCNRRFLKHYPQYKQKAQKSTVKTWWRSILERFTHGGF